MSLTDDASAINVMITPKTVLERARRADRFQVIVFPVYSIIGFVSTRAAIAGMVNARVPENGRAEKGRITHARTPAPSISRPRTTIRNSERFHEGGVKIKRVS